MARLQAGRRQDSINNFLTYFLYSISINKENIHSRFAKKRKHQKSLLVVQISGSNLYPFSDTMKDFSGNRYSDTGVF